MPHLPVARLRGRVPALVASAALVAGLSAALSPGEAEAGPASRFLDPVVHERPIHSRSGPFFALRVNSMDVVAEAERLAAFEYACSDFVPGSPPEKYLLVRTLHKGTVAPGECDEILSLLLPKGATARYHARMGTTRWIRREGPKGTPVGGFVGRLEVSATVSLATPETIPDLPLLDLRVAGTTGLRPMRGNADDATALAEGRCTAPRHDEGWYLGGFDRRTLVRILGKAADDPAHIAYVRTLARTIVGGTFEGKIVFSADGTTDPATESFDYEKIARAAWWFDGLAAADCRPHRRRPRPDVDATDEEPIEVSAAVDVEVR